jgi:hypothetical protein
VLGGSLSLSLSFGGEPSTSVLLKTLENHIGSLKFLTKKINIRDFQFFNFKAVPYIGCSHKRDDRWFSLTVLTNWICISPIL